VLSTAFFNKYDPRGVQAPSLRSRRVSPGLGFGRFLWKSYLNSRIQMLAVDAEYS
jgi:hypothetical protein